MPIIQVLPQEIGWTVVGCGQPQFFHSGFRAERAARQLAAAAAAAYGHAELLISDRSGQLAGRLRLDSLGRCQPAQARELEPA